MPVHVLDDARGQQEEGKTSSDWALLAREHVMRTLLETGWFTADDLDPLGIPEHYRRSVHGLVTAYFRGKQPYMEEAGRRKSERPERKGAKNTVFRITVKGRRELPALLKGLTIQLGREKLAGVGSANREGSAAANHGTLDRPAPNPGARSSDTADPGERSPEPPLTGSSGEPVRPYEPLSLLPEPDPESWAA
jgi:hypothetical protein